MRSNGDGSPRSSFRRVSLQHQSESNDRRTARFASFSPRTFLRRWFESFSLLENFAGRNQIGSGRGNSFRSVRRNASLVVRPRKVSFRFQRTIESIGQSSEKMFAEQRRRRRTHPSALVVDRILLDQIPSELFEDDRRNVEEDQTGLRRTETSGGRSERDQSDRNVSRRVDDDGSAQKLANERSSKTKAATFFFV